MSVLPSVERRDRDRHRVRTFGGQFADEGDISELDQRVRYIRTYADVGEVGSALDVVYHTWGNSSGHIFEGFQVATNLGTVGLLTRRRLLRCLSTNSPGLLRCLNKQGELLRRS